MITRLLLAALLASVAHLRADVRLPAIFGDHMVLQQDHKIPVWGTASPGERVTVTLGPRTAATAADASGRWRVDLDPVLTVSTPATLTVAGKNTLVFKDVLVGDIWFASGQSNMEFNLAKAQTASADIPKASDPQLRVFAIPRTNRLEPQTDMTGQWIVCTPQTAPAYTAVGYYFARELRQTLDRPIGLIASYWGGTPIKAWISFDGLKKPTPLADQLAEFERQQDYWLKNKDSYPQLLADYETAKKTWQDKANKAKAAGQTPPPSPRGPNNPLGSPNIPGSLYNGMVAPFIPYAIKGVIWYQGESDAGSLRSSTDYASLFARMITDWRTRWGQGDFPFLFVELAAHRPNRDRSQGVNWAWLRDSQHRALALPNTGMACAVDLGNPTDIHPKNKRDVGLRLAQAAKAVAYDLKVTPSGPSYESMRVEGDKIRLAFKYTDEGLKIGVAPLAPDGTVPAPPATLTDFTIAGADHKFVPAQARIESHTVIVWSDTVRNPIAVRYGWNDDPSLSLYSQHNLPVSPFRTDDWNP